MIMLAEGAGGLYLGVSRQGWLSDLRATHDNRIRLLPRIPLVEAAGAEEPRPALTFEGFAGLDFTFG